MLSISPPVQFVINHAGSFLEIMKKLQTHKMKHSQENILIFIKNLPIILLLQNYLSM